MNQLLDQQNVNSWGLLRYGKNVDPVPTSDLPFEQILARNWKTKANPKGVGIRPMHSASVAFS